MKKKVLYVIYTDFGVIDTTDEVINSIQDIMIACIYDFIVAQADTRVKDIIDKIKEADVVIYLDQRKKQNLRDEYYIKNICDAYNIIMLKHIK